MLFSWNLRLASSLKSTGEFTWQRLGFLSGFNNLTFPSNSQTEEISERFRVFFIRQLIILWLEEHKNTIWLIYIANGVPATLSIFTTMNDKTSPESSVLYNLFWEGIHPSPGSSITPPTWIYNNFIPLIAKNCLLPSIWSQMTSMSKVYSRSDRNDVDVADWSERSRDFPKTIEKSKLENTKSFESLSLQR